MAKVKVGEHRWMNISRRSLCDNCTAELCVYNKGGRVTECDKFTPILMAFKKCECCGEVFEVSSNFRALDYSLCQKCNEKGVERVNVGR
ncbi:hypothetical protein [Methanomassiliicoccus luminyensis]|jgi:hypothetical protein|uniref:hypothetical protein n=1 Tax=Methanomassiliicoccus luminyensis TaxID=1080712 RepID=UPI0011CA9E20|nr:hypothetical protein [Methanomassiliicoccus luminyensis]